MRTLLLLCLLAAGPANAAERLTLYAGESKVLDLAGTRRMVVGAPHVLEAKTLDETQVLLNGKEPGQTSLLVWDRHDQKTAYEVEVLASGLKRALIEIDVQVLEIADGVKWDVGLDWAGAMAGEASVVGVPASPLAVLEGSPPPLLSFGSFQRGPLGLRLDALVQNNTARILAKPRPRGSWLCHR